MYPVAAVPNTPAKTPAVLERPSNTPCDRGANWHLAPQGFTHILGFGASLIMVT